MIVVINVNVLGGTSGKEGGKKRSSKKTSQRAESSEVNTDQKKSKKKMTVKPSSKEDEVKEMQLKAVDQESVLKQSSSIVTSVSIDTRTQKQPFEVPNIAVIDASDDDELEQRSLESPTSRDVHDVENYFGKQ